MNIFQPHTKCLQCQFWWQCGVRGEVRGTVLSALCPHSSAVLPVAVAVTSPNTHTPRACARSRTRRLAPKFSGDGLEIPEPPWSMVTCLSSGFVVTSTTTGTVPAPCCVSTYSRAWCPVGAPSRRLCANCRPAPELLPQGVGRDGNHLSASRRPVPALP